MHGQDDDVFLIVKFQQGHAHQWTTRQVEWSTSISLASRMSFPVALFSG
jgi:hypothetical protein